MEDATPKIKAVTRAYSAGEKMAFAINEMVDLMYQNKTALHFYNGLLFILKNENEIRESKINNP